MVETELTRRNGSSTVRGDREVRLGIGMTEADVPARRRPEGSGTHREAGGGWLLLPREHGAWGMVALPFLAGLLVAGEWAPWRSLAALLAVFSVFLLRAPLTVLWGSRRSRLLGPRAVTHPDSRSARITLGICLAGAVACGGILLANLPWLPLLVLGGGGGALLVASVFFTVRNAQRSLLVQLLGAVGLTSSSLVAYLAVSGRLEAVAFVLWGMSATNAGASILVVRARLESIIAQRQPKSGPLSKNYFRRAAAMQAVLWSVLGVLALAGRPSLMLPFLPGSLWHGWELWQFHSNKGLRLSLRRVGWLQLGASLAFYFLLVAVLRTTPY